MSVRLPRADRKSLLLGTALASTLLLGTLVVAPAPAHAVVNCLTGAPVSPGAINPGVQTEAITCVNTETRTNAAGSAITLETRTNDDSFITLDNSGTLTATNGADQASGIATRTATTGSFITITNSGDIAATTTGAFNAHGILARASAVMSAIQITNSGDLSATTTGAGDARVIQASADSRITIDNTGSLTATSTGPDSADGMYISTGADGADIDITNSGDIEATSAASDAYGIRVRTDESSVITIDNSGDVTVSAEERAFGIYARMFASDSAIDITNSGDIEVTSAASVAYGIRARSQGTSGNHIDIVNSGAIKATSAGANAVGIDALQFFGFINIVNSGVITVSAAVNATGIGAETDSVDSGIGIVNSGAITATADGYATGLRAFARDDNGAVNITNSGALSVSAGRGAYGIDASSGLFAANSSVGIVNSGDITATSAAYTARGIAARTYYTGSLVAVTNSGDITVDGGGANGRAYGIQATTRGLNSLIAITNSGDITATSANGNAYGVSAKTGHNVYSDKVGNSIGIINSGDITATSGNGRAYGIFANSIRADSPISVTNSGDITATSSGVYASGIGAYTQAANSSITIQNSGRISAIGKAGAKGYGIWGETEGKNSRITIKNSGSVYASHFGIWSYSQKYANSATIINTGDISAGSHLAIRAYGQGNAKIYNSGTITGFVDLTEQDDLFVNQAGGVFEAKMTSLFNGGSDVFRNQSGGTVHALSDGGVAPSFTGLERFENRGTISTVDGSVGDHFTISNTVGGKDLDFVASGNSRLAVDAFLGASGSTSDTFTIEGNVSGTTAVTISNTNGGPGVLNTTGIKVVTVTGATPNANAFYLDQPVDTGFFDYDLFFTPTGSGFWSLKSFAGAGAFLLPQLVTAAQDIWHQSSSTWFDRTTDLRVLLNGGGAAAYDAGGKSLGVAPNDGIAPAVWVRGSGSWLQRDDSASTSAYGRNYQFDLDRDLETIDFQMGLDMGTRDFLSQGDALVFGLLGGFIHADLDYDSITRNFDYDGGQVGAYATYMKGGLFVDTLLNVHLYELDANNVGFPSELDATTVGLRTDTGYRFGSFSGGAFLEPLATIEVTWADIDGFSLGGNTVSFDDDANVRGRLGLRAGTTTEAWEGTMMEPFITGSLWGNLSGDNQATLVSSGSTFRFEDELDDVWGEVSAGVNFFNFSETTAVFAKVDVTFGEDVSGVGGKAGMRVSW